MGGESELVKARIALIEDIQKLGVSWMAVAEGAAVSSVRKPGDKEAASVAREAVVRHDERKFMADEVIKLVSATPALKGEAWGNETVNDPSP